jgi:hypothetical protein
MSRPRRKMTPTATKPASLCSLELDVPWPWHLVLRPDKEEIPADEDSEATSDE